jgi:hypothetical protein
LSALIKTIVKTIKHLTNVKTICTAIVIIYMLG